MQNQNNNSNYKRRPNYNNFNRSKPVSYFLQGAVFLSIFLAFAFMLLNIVGIISPKLVSKKALMFSNNSNLEFCCMQKKKKSSVCSKIVSFTESANINEIKKIQEKYYPIVKKICRYNFIKRIIISLFLILFLIVFLHRYKR